MFKIGQTAASELESAYALAGLGGNKAAEYNAGTAAKFGVTVFNPAAQASHVVASDVALNLDLVERNYG